MKDIMKKIQSARGFTLIELLIVVSILGVIATIAVPNVTSFMAAGTLNAANTEAGNIKTASVAYYSDHTAWPADSNALEPYVSGTIKAVYHFDEADGGVDSVTNSAWDELEWNSVAQRWILESVETGTTLEPEPEPEPTVKPPPTKPVKPVIPTLQPTKPPGKPTVEPFTR
jgi:prepilin-type N-terminal cleavage/methylation domain-containing protein